MKVTAIIPDDLIAEAMELSKSSTVTDTLKIALKTYIRSQKLKEF
ncbi:type II toxin-antitoxin system VapB family antitoxin [Belliella baltica]|nr:type II toxin-antitoxin system VapB family antitoxin [Belliella baltica]